VIVLGLAAQCDMPTRCILTAWYIVSFGLRVDCRNYPLTPRLSLCFVLDMLTGAVHRGADNGDAHRSYLSFVVSKHKYGKRQAPQYGRTRHERFRAGGSREAASEDDAASSEAGQINGTCGGVPVY